MDISAGVKLGPYEIVSPLGAGGMGEVYRARDTRLPREVAVKVLPAAVSTDPERLRRFELEARAASMLNHPNILMVFDVGSQDGVAYVVTELLEGSTLRERLSAPLQFRKSLDYALQIARGLSAAHAKGIVHRDLKPENIFITTEGHAKILDFGLAKLVEKEIPEFDMNRATTMPLKSQTGSVVGTVGYMSPEQARGEIADHRADIFSFGAIFYEMLSGQRAFKRETMAETMTAIIREEPADLFAINPSIPAGVEQIVSHCLEKSPDRRFQSARDLELMLANTPANMDSGESRKKTPAPAPRRRAKFAVIGSLGLLIAATIAFVIGRKTANPQATRWTFHPLTYRQGNLNRARFAPDGRNIVYSAFWDGLPVDVFMTSLDSPDSRSLGMLNSGLFSVSSTGELAISMGCSLNWGDCMGTLARVPLTGGAPRPVLDNVIAADWSPDGQSLAVAHSAAGRVRLEYPIGKILYESPGWISALRISPQGDRVAFFDNILGEESGSLCVIDNSGKKTVLETGLTATSGLDWAPSGNEVWFTAGRKNRLGDGGVLGVSLSGKERVVLPSVGGWRVEDVSKSGTVLLSSVGGGTRTVYTSPTSKTETKFYLFDWSTTADLSNDGRTLLFYEWGDAVDAVPTSYLVKTDGSDAIRLGEGKPLALSPEGNWALVVHRTSPPQLGLLPTGVGQAKLLPRGPINEFLLGGWFPDGHRIFFSGSEIGHLPRTYVQSTDGGNPEPATPEGSVAAILSPDGKTFAAIDRYGEYDLIPVNGGDSQPIDGMQPGDQLLQWSADGRSLYGRTSGDLELKIFRLDLATGRREIWKDLKPQDAVGLIGIPSDAGQVRITPDGKYYVYTYWTFIDQLFAVKRAE